ncbi:unnamed protein product, partial [Ilex paraguariensis]
MTWKEGIGKGDKDDGKEGDDVKGKKSVVTETQKEMYGGKNDREWQIVKGKSVVPRKGSVLKSSPKREARRGEVSLSRLEDPRQSE